MLILNVIFIIKFFIFLFYLGKKTSDGLVVVESFVVRVQLCLELVRYTLIPRTTVEGRLGRD